MLGNQSLSMLCHRGFSSFSILLNSSPTSDWVTRFYPTQLNRVRVELQYFYHVRVISKQKEEKESRVRVNFKLNMNLRAGLI